MRILAALLVGLALCGCSAQKNLQVAQRASDEFHLQFAKGNYGGIYDASGSEFKSSSSRDQIITFLQMVNSKLGACGEPESQSSNVNYLTSGTFATMIYKRKCANGLLEENFSWRLEDGKAVLRGYHVNSPALTKD